EAIDALARAAGAPVLDADGDDARALLARTPLPLAGEHQTANAGVAYRLARVLGIDDGAIARGLAATRWPGRMERIDGPDGPYLIDAAHNPDGAAALARHLATAGLPAKRALVFGALADKAWPEMIDRLAPLFPAASRVYVAPPGRAPAPPETIAARHPGAVAPSIDEACALARASATHDG